MDFNKKRIKNKTLPFIRLRIESPWLT